MRTLQVEKCAKQTEPSLQANWAMADALAAHIVVLDAEGVILGANLAWRQFAALNGMNCPHVGVGQNYLAICDAARGRGAEDAKSAAEGIRAVLAGSRSEFYLEYLCCAPHQERWFALRVSPFIDEHGARRLVVAHQDVTADKRAENLDRQQTVLNRALGAMEQMLGEVGHELRTPLAGLRITSEFLLGQEARESGDWRPLLAGLHEQTIQMSDIVDNLLEAARLNSGQAKWNWSRFSLGDICQDAVGSMRPVIDDSKVTLSWVTDPADLEMSGDAGAVRRLILNLLSNARKHTDRGRIEVDARREPDEGASRVRIRVRDTGEGIPPQIISRLGEAFALNSGAVGSQPLGGTGLGLAICKGIAAAHGGHLMAESVLGEGTAISAVLRADLPEPTAAPLAKNFSAFTSFPLERP